MPLEKVRKVLKIAKEPVSLETPVEDEEDSSLGDFIEDKNTLQPLDTAIQSNLSDPNEDTCFINSKRRKSSKNAIWDRNDTDHTLEEVATVFCHKREN